MTSPQENLISNEEFLEDLVSSLEISDSTQEKAEKRYESLGTWLDRDESSLKKFLWLLNSVLFVVYQILIFMEWYKNYRKT